MTLFRGAEHDLERLVRTHLFIIAPNNSGSTFLMNALATSAATWNLPREGQHCLGFQGPSTRSTGSHLIWASERKWIETFRDQSAYDWQASRKAWAFQAFARTPDASVLVVKSPPFLLNVAALERNFDRARFLFMVRNPYAVVEGICRRPVPAGLGTDPLDAAARHVLECLRRQKSNIAAFSHAGAAFTYEEMCADPTGTAGAIRQLVPEVDDLDLDQRIPVKGLYDSELCDMNAEQIARLSAARIERLGQVFAQERDLLRYFGYDLL